MAIRLDADSERQLRMKPMGLYLFKAYCRGRERSNTWPYYPDKHGPNRRWWRA